jgi:hypothetical protein
MTEAWLTPETYAFLRQESAPRARFKGRYSYYHDDTLAFFQNVIQHDSRVLVIGCDVGDLASRLQAAEVCVMDLDAESAGRFSHPSVRAVDDLSKALEQTAFDYVLLPYTLQYLENIQVFLETLRSGLKKEARVVVLGYNFLWAPMIKLAQRLGLKTPTPDLNWLSPRDVRNLFDLTRLQSITEGGRCLLPFSLPLISRWVNMFLAPLPFIRQLCQKSFAVARVLPGPMEGKGLSVSVVVPARNEAGNIEPLMNLLPRLGARCELIFIEGHSTDNTWEEIQRQTQNHARRGEFEIQVMQQTGEGKADAVRQGFARATGDILMILDSDLSVRPKDLGLFYNALVSGAADFVNGSRLVYKMENEAMQILNLFFNSQFGLFVSWLIGQSVKDTLCGTKVLFRKDYLRIQRAYPELSKRDPFGDFELLFGAGRLCLKICDAPVAYKQRTYGSTNIRRFRHGWQLLKMCLASWPELKA